jgi:hypothetical protein
MCSQEEIRWREQQAPPKVGSYLIKHGEDLNLHHTSVSLNKKQSTSNIIKEKQLVKKVFTEIQFDNHQPFKQLVILRTTRVKEVVTSVG